MIEIKEKNKCCGCGACANKCPKRAIEMVEDKNGFLFPKINKELCIDCGLCNKVCPIMNSTNNEEACPKCYACYNNDEKIRMQSSSGGIFTLIAEEIIKMNGIVFGAAFTENYLVEHIYVDNSEDLKKLRTSKYFQSNIGDAYKKVQEFLKNDKYVLFTGTPCQIEGLLKFLGKHYEKLYTQDIVCHGVPSKKVWSKYLEYRKKIDKENPVEINFRDKKQEGWKMFSLSFKYKDFEYHKNQKEDLYMKAFLSDVCLRDSCYSCAFRKKFRFSDITLADYWRIQNIHPEMDDDKGTSLVLVNTKKGEELYSKILDKISSKEVTMDDAIVSNKAIIKSPEKNKYRTKFFNSLGNKEFNILIKKYVPKKSLVWRIKSKLVKIIKKHKAIYSVAKKMKTK